MQPAQGNSGTCSVVKVIIIFSICVSLFTALLVGILIITRTDNKAEKHESRQLSGTNNCQNCNDNGRNVQSDTQTHLCKTEQCVKQAKRMLRNMDASVDPCINFYNFTCGNFMRYAKIPKDQSRLLVVLKNMKIVEKEMIHAYNADSNIFIPPIREIKTFYHQCINSVHNEIESTRTFKQILKQLRFPVINDHWNVEYSKTFNWLDEEVRLSKMGLSPVFLNTELKLDRKNFSAAYIGLDCTAPHLQKNMLKDIQIMREYRSIIQRFLQIAGGNHRKQNANEILVFLLKVEKIKPTTFEMSEANFLQSFKTIDVKTLQEELNISIVKFLNDILPTSVTVTNDTVIGTNTYQCLINMIPMLNNEDKRQIANYMMWTGLQSLLWIINKSTRRLNFRLSRLETGVQAPSPLYRQCKDFIDEQLPELSSAMYTKINYSTNQKKKLTTMVNLILKYLSKAVNAATWMDESTKKTAKEKVKQISYVVGYTDSVTQEQYLSSTYKKLKMEQNVIANVRNIRRVAYMHMMKTIHWSAKQRNDASLLPLAHVINAYYHPGLNAIAIPAGITKGYVYSTEQSAYLNFGAMGIIIGHELSHVFDNVGRLYNAKGEYVNWWSTKSNSKFIDKAECFVKQYDNFTLGDNLKMNGTLTLSENMADLGGTLLAYQAFREWKIKYKISHLPGFENYTMEQMFWISVGNTWCDKMRPERLKMFLKTDVHSVGMFRVLGPLSNSKEFSKDFECTPDSPMNRKGKCTIW